MPQTSSTRLGPRCSFGGYLWHGPVGRLSLLVLQCKVERCTEGGGVRKRSMRVNTAVVKEWDGKWRDGITNLLLREFCRLSEFPGVYHGLLSNYQRIFFGVRLLHSCNTELAIPPFQSKRRWCFSVVKSNKAHCTTAGSNRD